MLIDWFTVGAEALNFVVLVWLLKRFLYQPILHAIDVREKSVAAKLADADAKAADAQKERDELKAKNDAFDQQRAALLAKANEDAVKERARLLTEARRAADDLTAKREKTLHEQDHDLEQTIRTRTREQVFAVARMALRDLAGATLEDRIGAIFVERLGRMDATTKAALGGALAGSPALLRTALGPSPEQRAVLQKALDAAFARSVPVRFETTPALVGGIELVVGGQKLAWTLAGYLDGMEKHIVELDEAKDAAPKSEPKVKAKPAPANAAQVA